MKNLRRWQLSSQDRFVPQIAADARLSRTNYVDDQIWKLALGKMDQPALALQTQYGRRAGLASLLPMWVFEGRVIHETQTYASSPILTHFAPNYLRTESAILPDLELISEYWTMESQAVGGIFTLHNTANQPITCRLDLFAHVIRQQKEQRLNILTLEDQTNAIHMGQIGHINPVVIMENASADFTDGFAISPKIGVDLELNPGSSHAIRWVHAGMTHMRDSLALTLGWLAQDWSTYFQQINQAAKAIPIIQTGNKDWDLLVAMSYNQVIQSFLKPTNSLPYGSFVAERHPLEGYSPKGDGSDHPRSWSGQDPTLAYMITPVMASIDPQLAQGVVQNYLAVQSADGWIDRQPGLAGQQQDMLSMPLLARMAWNIYQQSENKEFVEAVTPGLHQFFERWFYADVDADGDGLPEWQHEHQMGTITMPTFAAGQGWSQGADIRYLESPDMAAYLLSEANSLQQLLTTKTVLKSVEKRQKQLTTALDSLWNGNRYTYRDRDTHQAVSGTSILEEGQGSEEHFVAASLDVPNRLVVRIVGGVSHIPRITLYVDGLNANGTPIQEVADADTFYWQNRQGTYTTQNVFSQVDRVQCEGLSRVYTIHVNTVDSTGLDINTLLPLWSKTISQKRADKLVKLIGDKKHFWQPNGVSMVSHQDERFDPSNADGGGAIWLFWLTLVGEGLVDYGYGKQAADLMKRLLKALTAITEQDKEFSQFYHAEDTIGLGEGGHLAGIVPLYLLQRILGVRIISSSKVYVGGEFVWGRGVTIKQHGVTIRRTAKGTKITFPSKHKVELAADAKWQAINDPEPVQDVDIDTPDPPEIARPQSSGRQPSRRISIEVEQDE